MNDMNGRPLQIGDWVVWSPDLYREVGYIVSMNGMYYVVMKVLNVSDYLGNSERRSMDVMKVSKEEAMLYLMEQ